MKFLWFLIFMVNLINAAQIQSIKADFTQTLEGEGEVIKYSGYLVATADSNAYWRYDNPIKKEIFINENQATIYEPNINQAIINRKINIDFVKIINEVKVSGDKMISQVNGVTYEISLKDGKPQQIFYIDELDNKIEINLHNVILNQKIDSSIFVPKIPEDADIIAE